MKTIQSVSNHTPDDDAETFRAALRRYIGRQETFFACLQETFVNNVIKLLKKTQTAGSGSLSAVKDITLLDLARVLEDTKVLHERLNKYKAMYGHDELVDYFEDESQNHQRLSVGLKMFLKDICALKNAKQW